MQEKRVLVTGGAGFIGSHLANYLSQKNDVLAIDNEYLGTPENLDDRVEYQRRSVLDEHLPVDDVDVVFHFGSYSSRQMHAENPRKAQRVNIEGTVSLLEQATTAGVDSVVVASSSSVYDNDPPGREDDRVTAGSRYEASMLAREEYAAYYDDTTDTAVACPRFFSVYQGFGDGSSEGHKGQYANTLSQWADRINMDIPPVLWGDGEQTRDFIHVHDVVTACEQIAEHQLSGPYNVGTGVSHSFNEVVEALNRELHDERTIEPQYEPVPLDNYNYRQRADISKLRSQTVWRPRVEFAEGVRMVCEQYL